MKRYDFEQVLIGSCVAMEISEKGAVDKSQYYHLSLSSRTSCSSCDFDFLTMDDLVLLHDALTEFFLSEGKKGGKK